MFIFQNFTQTIINNFEITNFLAIEELYDYNI